MIKGWKQHLFCWDWALKYNLFFCSEMSSHESYNCWLIRLLLGGIWTNIIYRYLSLYLYVFMYYCGCLFAVCVYLKSKAFMLYTHKFHLLIAFDNCIVIDFHSISTSLWNISIIYLFIEYNFPLSSIRALNNITRDLCISYIKYDFNITDKSEPFSNIEIFFYFIFHHKPTKKN